ncbi:phosphoglycerate dehydrogenase [Texcoconibacillus texcoconensis]|uniref:D-3-phosphoglycerate dehydrogenase n=1 Tax=Texcoconibacillus texcoconensis TaxID=1095777 RepID=A0A840QNK7_9BACI|nr:phosphoglycerate dehydrogenase [Texcoconibacillus texcoconensis]MBB5172938.1 D-3-phosphoglycerate dehydrogenase [Texcoconibacillus texcoconensis]
MEAVEEKQVNSLKTYTVLVSDKMSEVGLAPLEARNDIDIVKENIHETTVDLTTIDALLIRSATKVTEEVLCKLPNLKIIGRAGVGVDNIDIEASTKRGIAVINAPEGNTISTAEHTFSMLCSLARNIPQAHASMCDGKWERSSFQGMELRGKTLAIIGYGRIGSELATRAKAFQMDVIVYDPYLNQRLADKHGITIVSFQEAIENGDIITVHTPLTNETKGMISYDAFKKMKPTTRILNCARGGIIDENALIEAIEKQQIAGAALDVFTEEPLKDERLTQSDRIITTPHIAASTKEAQENVASQVANEALNYLDGEPAINAINVPAIPKNVYESLLPFHHLTKQMGSFASQCMKQPANDITLQFSGEWKDQESSILTRSFIGGFLDPLIDDYVNDINSSMIAESRGISYGHKKSDENSGYSHLIQAHVKGDNDEFSIAGTYNEEFGARIVRVNGYPIDVQPDEHLLYIHHRDLTGVIGKVGQCIGTHDINIATMQVGRKEEGGEAIMMLAIDKKATSNLIEDLKTLDEIKTVSLIEL